MRKQPRYIIKNNESGSLKVMNSGKIKSPQKYFTTLKNVYIVELIDFSAGNL